MLADCGLNVVAIVCDQGPSNQRLFSLLGVSPEKPYIDVHGKLILTLFNPPHLLKSVKKNLLKHIRFEGSKVAKWAVISNFYSFDKQGRYKSAPKLTDEHVYVRNKMKVRYAAQVFSHTVAASLCLLQTNSASEDYSGTSDFVGEMDSLFDIVNSQSLTHTKELARAITQSSRHITVLDEKLKFVR